MQNHSRDHTGRFTVSLPVKDNYRNIGNTLELATKRFLSLEQRFKGNQAFYELYSKFMDEYIQLGHMTLLDKSQIHSNETVYYMPHHGVIKLTSATTKLRVVFDASAKSTTNVSLNDALYVGPTIQDDLFSILLRFRKHNFVLKADITKMYRQVMVEPRQRNLQRILWRENPEQTLSHYSLNTVTYGTAPASFLAIRSLHQAAKDSWDDYTKASNTILSDFYVDDLITGDDTIEDLRQLKIQISYILKSAGFTLTQWRSNCARILESDEQQQNFHFSDNEATKTLGILWNPNLDKLQFAVNIKLHAQTLTKRTVLSIIGQIFDPLGIIGPIVIKAKLILQQLWKMRVGWDEPIPSNYHTEFLNFFHKLTELSEISVPRHVLLSEYSRVQIHGFTDASERAYGVCVYARSTDSHGQVFSQLLCSKSRVAPLKVISLPRLELCGALLLAQLIDKVIKVLNLCVHDVFLWTDSKIVLAWLSHEPTRWKTFICNRVSEIQGLTDIKHWNHVKSSENPADIISRGCDPNLLLKSDLWWSGPPWLQHESSTLTDNLVQIYSDLQDVPEERKPPGVVLLASESHFDLITKFSDLTRLVRVTALCLRFIKNLKTKGREKITGKLSSQECERAMDLLVKFVQDKEFSKEIEGLKKSKLVPKTSKLISLNPFIDNKGILRVGGRLINASVSYDKKFPILLPGKHLFTDLIIKQEHERTLHGGVQMVLSSVRSKFWPIRAKNAIKAIVRKCITCFKTKPISLETMMGQLPASRVNPSRPFHSIGIDFAGPFMLKEGTLRSRKLVKAYVCVFICFSTKAVHLELSGDLSTPTFLNVLKRFCARRGIPKDIWSDNGLNFVGAANKLENTFNIVSTVQQADVQNYLLDNRVTWHFIPPRAPHFGGLWESAVKLMKHHLVRVIGLSHLTYEHFYTILTQVESILNSRPITPLSNDPNDLEPLTPGHFLIGTKLNALPEENVEAVPLNRLDKYRQLQHIIQAFWRRWSKEYLHNLQQRTKWMFSDSTALKPGLLVLLREDNLSPMHWKTGRITEIHPGDDNITRVVSVKTASGIVKRAFTKVCPLPIDTDKPE